MNLKKHLIKITGIAPLLQNSAANLDKKAPMGKGGSYIPEAQAKHVSYASQEGKAFHPSMGFRKALLMAAGGKKHKKRTLRSLIASSVFVTTEETMLVDPQTNKPYKADAYTIDARPVVRNKARVTAWRPRWDKWGAILELEIDEDLVDPSARNVKSFAS